MNYFVLGIIFLLLFVVYHSIKSKKEMKERNLSGPLMIPIFGFLWHLIYKAIYFEDNIGHSNFMFGKYGDTFFIKPPGANLFITKDPEVIKYTTSPEGFHNFQRLDHSNKSIQITVTKALFGNGIFMADGHDWKIQREVANPLFKIHSLSNMRDVFQEKANVFIEILNNFADTKEEFDIQKYFFKYTLDSFGKIGFGVDLNSLREDIKFPEHFDVAQRLLTKAFENPFYFKYSSQQKEFKTSNDYIQNFISQTIKNHDRNGEDLLSKFSKLKDQNGDHFPDKWLKEIIINFAVAGRDTTAILMTWMIYCITSNERVLQRVREEINRVLVGDEDDPEKNPFSEKNLKKMKYMDNVIKETLRLYPSVPLVHRFASQDCELPNKSIIKKGDRIIYLSLFVHRDPRYFPKPLEFIPERWDENSPEYIKGALDHTHAYVPFHAGEMQCIGRHMAAMEAKLLISILLKNFFFKLKDNQEVKPLSSFVMPVESGLFVSVRKNEGRSISELKRSGVM